MQREEGTEHVLLVSPEPSQGAGCWYRTCFSSPGQAQGAGAQGDEEAKGRAMPGH